MSASAEKAMRVAEHGRHIFIYSNIRTNQVIYSLNRSLNNHSSLQQLVYAGKKTVPASLRKDVWRPLATVTFPSPTQGMTAYNLLLQFRKLHEMHWDTGEYPMLPPDVQKKLKETGNLPTRKERAKVIMDQKANTVADLAAVLEKQNQVGEKQRAELERKSESAAKLEAEFMKRLEMKAAALGKAEGFESAASELESMDPLDRLPDGKRKARITEINRLKKIANSYRLAARQLERIRAGEVTARELLDQRLKGPVPKKGWRRKLMLRDESKLVPFTSEGVSVSWADILDAQYAESWPSGVLHGVLDQSRHTAPKPQQILPKHEIAAIEEATTEEAATVEAATEEAAIEAAAADEEAAPKQASQEAR
ncbi:uncharacterized protein K452DRAFT_288640 [Aplosporella prunicola CBS 121167]|uniref:Large ribosomal subunit protein mL67 n=1 Tax=Aplosporella prunicola CBS 121167 TaxID=1176127 RepID=A0A6A6B8R1_9PEZI|nr:uncharacterized protein K452DRAFT_288640 [Aplosporella prunicola CBS 121167]KAF2140559.1 hypothetical protein K452DRAFT_288640 [Aplosporella prunicola CBS 121167]